MSSTGTRNQQRKTKGAPALHKRQIKHHLKVKPQLLKTESILQATPRKAHMQRPRPRRTRRALSTEAGGKALLPPQALNTRVLCQDGPNTSSLGRVAVRGPGAGWRRISSHETQGEGIRVC